MRLLCKDQLCMWLQKSGGAESLVAWPGEMCFWCEQPGCCSRVNCHVALLELPVCTRRYIFRGYHYLMSLQNKPPEISLETRDHYPEIVVCTSMMHCRQELLTADSHTLMETIWQHVNKWRLKSNLSQMRISVPTCCWYYNTPGDVRWHKIKITAPPLQRHPVWMGLMMKG